MIGERGGGTFRRERRVEMPRQGDQHRRQRPIESAGGPRRHARGLDRAIEACVEMAERS